MLPLDTSLDSILHGKPLLERRQPVVLWRLVVEYALVQAYLLRKRLQLIEERTMERRRLMSIWVGVICAVIIVI